MADLVQRLILFAAFFSMAAGLDAQSPAFSHRKHLQLGLECLSCHTAAAKSTQAGDNLLPAKEACLNCHESALIKTPAATRVTRFNHSKHVPLGKSIAPLLLASLRSGAYLAQPDGLAEQQLKSSTSACTACHRGLETSDAVSKANFPQMADCLVCHSKIDPPFSCEFCHAPGDDLKPASHTPDYLDAHNSGKLKLDKTACAVCHGRKFTCLGCH